MRSMRWWTAAAVGAVILVAALPGRAAERENLRSRLEAWSETQGWSSEASYSGVVFDQAAYEDFFDKEYLPQLRFGGGWYPLPNLNSTILVGGMYEPAEAIGQITGESSGIDSTLLVLPVQWNLRYRFRLLDNQWVVPSVWAGLDYWYFQINTEGVDNIEGDKTGWHWGADLGLLLDTLDPMGATSMKKYWGVDDTYLCFGYERLAVGENEDGLKFSGEVYSLSLRFDTDGK